MGVKIPQGFFHLFFPANEKFHRVVFPDQGLRQSLEPAPVPIMVMCIVHS